MLGDALGTAVQLGSRPRELMQLMRKTDEFTKLAADGFLPTRRQGAERSTTSQCLKRPVPAVAYLWRNSYDY